MPIPREADLKAADHATRLRAAVEKYMRENGVGLKDALRRVLDKAEFSATLREGREMIAQKHRESETVRGWARGAFCRAVESKKVELMNREPKLSELAAFREASEYVARNDSSLLAYYRADVEVIRER